MRQIILTIKSLLESQIQKDVEHNKKFLNLLKKEKSNINLELSNIDPEDAFGNYYKQITGKSPKYAGYEIFKIGDIQFYFYWGSIEEPKNENVNYKNIDNITYLITANNNEYIMCDKFGINFDNNKEILELFDNIDINKFKSALESAINNISNKQSIEEYQKFATRF